MKSPSEDDYSSIEARIAEATDGLTPIDNGLGTGRICSNVPEVGRYLRRAYQEALLEILKGTEAKVVLHEPIKSATIPPHQHTNSFKSNQRFHQTQHRNKLRSRK